MKQRFRDEREKGFIIGITAALTVIILRNIVTHTLGSFPVSKTIWYTALLSIISLVPPMLFRVFYEKPEKRKKAKITVIVLMTAGAVILCSVLNILISLIPGAASAALIITDPRSFFEALICVCIIPAVLEELLFRWVIMDAFFPLGDKWTVVLSAAAFALVHSDMRVSLYAFCAGIIFGILRIKSGRLLPVMAAHFLVNLTAMMIINNL